jgi:putative transposase
MGKRRFTPEQIVSMLREAELLLGKGQHIAEKCRGIGITGQTYHRWRKEYGGLRVDQAKRLKGLEQEYSHSQPGSRNGGGS